MKRYFLGIGGASGFVYGLRVARALAGLDCELHFSITDKGRAIAEHESGESFVSNWNALKENARAKLFFYDNNDFFAPPASGSFILDAMIVAPCSMSAAAAIANACGGDLLRRVADVQLKERRRLVLLIRETPLSTIHLRQLLSLSEAGALIVPATPAFYHKPNSIDQLVDFMAGRALSAAGIQNELCPPWLGNT